MVLLLLRSGFELLSANFIVATVHRTVRLRTRTAAGVPARAPHAPALVSVEKETGKSRTPVRNLNRRIAPLERSHCSFRLRKNSMRFELLSATSIVATAHRAARLFRLRKRPARHPDSCPQPQSSHCSLGAVALLVSVDSLRSLPASQDSPPGYRFLRSPLHCPAVLVKSAVPALPQAKEPSDWMALCLWSIGDSNS